MNILGGNGMQSGGIPPQLMQNIQQVKGLMNIVGGNPMALMQNNPQFGQLMQMCQGQNPQVVFENMCKQQGVDPNAVINALKQ